MKYPKVIYLFLSVSLFQNCNQKEPFEASNALHTIEIKKDFLLNQVNELKFKATDTIDLERPGNPPLTTIQDVVFSTESIFLLDRKHGLLKYDDAGNFLQSIGKKGEGPDEYLMPTAIYLNEVENVALIADWEKMVVTSYDLEGNFIASSGKIPGRPISFYKEGDNLLMILEGIESYGEGSQTVLVSSINPTTLDLTSEVTTLYGFSSKFYRIHQYLRPFGEINDTLLFYLPRVRLAGLADHMDTIYRMEVGHLLPEYQLDFTDFPKSDTIQIDLIEINQGYARINLRYKKASYHLMLDLTSKTPTYSMKLPAESYSMEVFPKQLNKDLFYSIIRNRNEGEEENPKIVIYALSKKENNLSD